MSRFLLALTCSWVTRTWLRMASARKCRMRRRFRPAVRCASSSGVKSLHSGKGLSPASRLRPAGFQEAQPFLGVGQVDAHLGDVRVLQQSRVEFGGGFGDQDDADIEPGHFRGGRPFEEGDQVHAFLGAGVALPPWRGPVSPGNRRSG